MEELKGRKVFLKELNSLNDTWLNEVWILNKGIQSLVIDYDTENKEFNLLELLKELGSGSAIHDYNIDEYGRSFINVNDEYKFLINLSNMLRTDNHWAGNYPDLDEDTDYAIDLLSARDSVNKYGLLYDELDDRLDELLKKVVDQVIELLLLELEESDNDNLYYIFTELVNSEFYNTWKPFENVYIKGGEGFTAYEDTIKDYLR